MATYLFAWNPAIWNWPQLARDIRTLARRGHFDDRMVVRAPPQHRPGSRAFLVRLGVPPKGIFGSGVTLTAPASARHWIEEKAAAGILTNYTRLRLDRLFETPLVTFDELTVPPFRRYRWGVRSSGTYLPETIADALEEFWERRVAATTGASPPRRSVSGRGRPFHAG